MSTPFSELKKTVESTSDVEPSLIGETALMAGKVSFFTDDYGNQWAARDRDQELSKSTYNDLYTTLKDSGIYPAIDEVGSTISPNPTATAWGATWDYDGESLVNAAVDGKGYLYRVSLSSDSSIIITVHSSSDKDSTESYVVNSFKNDSLWTSSPTALRDVEAVVVKNGILYVFFNRSLWYLMWDTELRASEGTSFISQSVDGLGSDYNTVIQIANLTTTIFSLHLVTRSASGVNGGISTVFAINTDDPENPIKYRSSLTSDEYIVGITASETGELYVAAYDQGYFDTLTTTPQSRDVSVYRLTGTGFLVTVKKNISKVRTIAFKSDINVTSLAYGRLFTGMVYALGNLILSYSSKEYMTTSSTGVPFTSAPTHLAVQAINISTGTVADFRMQSDYGYAVKVANGSMGPGTYTYTSSLSITVKGYDGETIELSVDMDRESPAGKDFSGPIDRKDVRIPNFGYYGTSTWWGFLTYATFITLMNRFSIKNNTSITLPQRDALTVGQAHGLTTNTQLAFVEPWYGKHGHTGTSVNGSKAGVKLQFSGSGSSSTANFILPKHSAYDDTVDANLLIDGIYTRVK